MNRNYWIIEDVWREIKTYLFHNIKIHGKHLKNDKYVKKFNKIVKSLPGKYIPRTGPRIVYCSATRPFRYVKFIYKVPAPIMIKQNMKRYKLLIEWMPMNNLDENEIKMEYYKDVIPYPLVM